MPESKSSRSPTVTASPLLPSAIGITGTEVVRETSEIVLLDDNFTAIVAIGVVLLMLLEIEKRVSRRIFRSVW